MTLSDLLRLIGLPEEAAEGALKFAERGMEALEPFVSDLTHPERDERAERGLEERLRGAKWGVLACLLLAAGRAHEQALRLGIRAAVFADKST